MTDAQKLFFPLGLIAIISLCLVPPWLVRSDSRSGYRYAGHRFIFYTGPSVAAMGSASYRALEEKLEYQFANVGLLQEALTHKSLIGQDTTKDIASYERLEFLGDSILSFLLTKHFFNQTADSKPRCMQKDLTKMKNFWYGDIGFFQCF